MSTSFWSTGGPTSRVPSPFDTPAPQKRFVGVAELHPDRVKIDAEPATLLQPVRKAVLHELRPCLAGGFLLVDGVERDALAWFAFRRRSGTTLLTSKSLRLD